MKYYAMIFGWSALLCALQAPALLADDESDNDRSQQQKRDDRDQDNGVRVHYDDDSNRLSIDANEDVQFRDDNSKRDWVKGGEFDLRYDTDRNDLRAAGEGTIDMDRAAGQIANWWQSWWDEERRARSNRASSESSQTGAQYFIQQHDRNDDGYLARGELPTRMRDDFDRVDRNGDDYLSRSELQRYGQAVFDFQNRSSSNSSNQARSSRSSNSSSSSGDDQTWSQWWASWWSDESNGQTSDEAATSGAREFIRRNDRNDDGYLVRSEMPRRMYDDFQRIDANDDRYLSRSEIRNYAAQHDLSFNRNRSQSQSQRTANSSRSSTTQSPNVADAAYLKIVDVPGEAGNAPDLQEAYRLLTNLDTNSDRYISLDELQEQRQQVARDFANRWFTKCDLNDDGKLTRSEASGSILGQDFDRFDQDGDGKVTKSEVRRGVEDRIANSSRGNRR
jgi:Ca2+-binding EF-hand superfamily protein